MNRFLTPILLTVTLILGAYSGNQNEANVPKDHFDRKVKCAELAYRVEKDRFDEKSGSGFTQVQYSPKRHSCVAAITLMGKNRQTFMIEDLLTGETLWTETCEIAGDCIPTTDKEEEEIKKLAQPE